MKKILAVLAILAIGLTGNELYADEITTAGAQVTYTTAQTNTTIWTPTQYDCIVLEGFIISSNSSQKISLSASDPIVKLHLTASQPVISPAGFEWDGDKDETILITTECGEVYISLFGYEEID
jgi:hypothetical protein